MNPDLTARLGPLDPDHPDARALIAMSEAYMGALYPAESNHFEPASGLRPPHGDFWGLCLGDALVGCGGVKVHTPAGEPAYGEIKRLFVLDSARGHGAAKRLMAHIEAALQARGVALARLETGIHQPEAIGLYRRLGYVERNPFGDYAPDPLSLFMEKRLT
ncbi:MAG: GNAT family N-acetyltransferase [Burkholderiales bacterium]|nr:MAG: GNAT family N-acetyltransferase [Burkholderiales bacterium]